MPWIKLDNDQRLHTESGTRYRPWFYELASGLEFQITASDFKALDALHFPEHPQPDEPKRFEVRIRDDGLKLFIDRRRPALVADMVLCDDFFSNIPGGADGLCILLNEFWERLRKAEGGRTC